MRRWAAHALHPALSAVGVYDISAVYRLPLTAVQSSRSPSTRRAPRSGRHRTDERDCRQGRLNRRRPCVQNGARHVCRWGWSSRRTFWQGGAGAELAPYVELPAPVRLIGGAERPEPLRGESDRAASLNFWRLEIEIQKPVLGAPFSLLCEPIRACLSPD